MCLLQYVCQRILAILGPALLTLKKNKEVYEDQVFKLKISEVSPEFMADGVSLTNLVKKNSKSESREEKSDNKEEIPDYVADFMSTDDDDE